MRGTGASWTTSEVVDIGYDAFGILRVEDGAVVNAGTSLSVDIADAGGGGLLVLDNGTVNTPLLSADALELTGSGTVNTSGFGLRNRPL